jgi:hypothetical protein
MDKNLKVENFVDLLDLGQKMREFQLVHNELKRDFLGIYKVAIKNIDNEQLVNPLVRACVKELFSLIEADLYLLNQFNPYPGYVDRDSFLDKFKNTYKHHARIFGKEEIHLQFNSRTIEALIKQKEIRDRTTHPKGQRSILVDTNILEKINELYLKYTNYVSTMMTNVFISTKINLSDL